MLVDYTSDIKLTTHTQNTAQLEKPPKGTHRGSHNPVKVASPEDNTGGGVGGLVLHTETGPHGIVRASSYSCDEEGEDVCDGVDLAGDTHVEEHNCSDEHSQESDEQEVANRVGVVIREGNNRLLLGRSLLEHGSNHRFFQGQARRDKNSDSNSVAPMEKRVVSPRPPQPEIPRLWAWKRCEDQAVCRVLLHTLLLRR
jgi:hypothetical protein